MTYQIELSQRDCRLLWSLTKLPSWIIDEWKTRYEECNADPLPIATVASILTQVDTQHRDQTGKTMTEVIEEELGISDEEIPW